MMKIFCLVALLFCYSVAEEVRLLDLEPNDAQNIIDSKDTTLKYAPKIESNVPAVRFLGNEPHNVQEDIYLANQYHGQDGLGGYLYGYSVPDIAKTERKKAGGELRGAYNYITNNGEEIKVQYWDDGTGFHQVDNVPQVLPKQIDDTPEVKAAKENFDRIWHEEAERNSHPIQNPYPQAQASQLVNQYQQQRQEFPNPGQNVFYKGGHEGYLGVGSQQNGKQATGIYGGFTNQGSNGQNSGVYNTQYPSNPGNQGQGYGSYKQSSAFAATSGAGQTGAGLGSSSGHFGQASGVQSNQGASASGSASGASSGGQIFAGQSGNQGQGYGSYKQSSAFANQAATSGAGQTGAGLGSSSGQSGPVGQALGVQSNQGASAFGASSGGHIFAGQSGQSLPTAPGSSSSHLSASGAFGGNQNKPSGQPLAFGQGSGNSQSSTFSSSQSVGNPGVVSNQGPSQSGFAYKPQSPSSVGQGQGSGQSAAQSSGQFGQASGQAFGQSSGQAFGQSSGQASGQSSGQFGQASGHSSSQLPGAGQYASNQGASNTGAVGGHAYIPPSQTSYSSKYSENQYAASQQSNNYASREESSNEWKYNPADDNGDWKYNPSEEEKGPPKGFFYNFDYPVGIIVQKDGKSLQDVYSNNKANYENQLKTGSSGSSSSSSGYLAVK